MEIKLAITIKGPKGMYSLIFFFFAIINIILIIAPIKNEIIDIANILEEPKNNPKAAISFTSPNPIESFPDTILPRIVNIPKITVPKTIPSNISIARLISDNPKINVNNIPDPWSDSNSEEGTQEINLDETGLI